jgi:DNA-binding XRE family transcriptional regulator
MAALRVLYVKHGTWRAVGKLIGVSRPVISRLSRGEDKPGAGIAIRAAKLVGASVEDVLSGNFAQVRECPMCGGCGTVATWTRSEQENTGAGST